MGEGEVGLEPAEATSQGPWEGLALMLIAKKSHERAFAG